jgi:hypothetical protein
MAATMLLHAGMAVDRLQTGLPICSCRCHKSATVSSIRHTYRSPIPSLPKKHMKRQNSVSSSSWGNMMQQDEADGAHSSSRLLLSCRTHLLGGNMVHWLFSDVSI